VFNLADVSTSRAHLAILAVASVLTIGFGCTRSAGPAPQTASGGQQDWDAGLPVPAASSKKSVIVPTDVGAGSGPSGPGPSGGTSSSPGGALQAPGGGN
jgi:hypothetical protein